MLEAPNYPGLLSTLAIAARPATTCSRNRVPSPTPATTSTRPPRELGRIAKRRPTTGALPCFGCQHPCPTSCWTPRATTLPSPRALPATSWGGWPRWQIAIAMTDSAPTTPEPPAAMPPARPAQRLATPLKKASRRPRPRPSPVAPCRGSTRRRCRRATRLPRARHPSRDGQPHDREHPRPAHHRRRDTTGRTRGLHASVHTRLRTRPACSRHRRAGTSAQVRQQPGRDRRGRGGVAAADVAHLGRVSQMPARSRARVEACRGRGCCRIASGS